jgi:hypothetical protein
MALITDGYVASCLPSIRTMAYEKGSSLFWGYIQQDLSQYLKNIASPYISEIGVLMGLVRDRLPSREGIESGLALPAKLSPDRQELLSEYLKTDLEISRKAIGGINIVCGVVNAH